MCVDSSNVIMSFNHHILLFQEGTRLALRAVKCDNVMVSITHVHRNVGAASEEWRHTVARSSDVPLPKRPIHCAVFLVCDERNLLSLALPPNFVAPCITPVTIPSSVFGTPQTLTSATGLALIKATCTRRSLAVDIDCGNVSIHADCTRCDGLSYNRHSRGSPGGVTTPARYETAILKTVLTSARPPRIGTLSAPQPFFCEKYIFLSFFCAASCLPVVLPVVCQLLPVVLPKQRAGPECWCKKIKRNRRSSQNMKY